MLFPTIYSIIQYRYVYINVDCQWIQIILSTSLVMLHKQSFIKCNKSSYIGFAGLLLADSYQQNKQLATPAARVHSVIHFDVFYHTEYCLLQSPLLDAGFYKAIT